jgi:hypothetical protein
MAKKASKKKKPNEYVSKGAQVSPCGLYRYDLSRVWDPDRPPVLWVMLNPSKADADVDDPTIEKVVKFSRRWGYGSLVVVNLFAWRATKPDAMLKADEPVGSLNDAWIAGWAGAVADVVCAWGTAGVHRDRGPAVLALLRGLAGERKLWYLERTKDGHPKHPLFVRDDQERQLFPAEGG